MPHINIVTLLNLWDWHSTQARRMMYQHRHEKNNVQRMALGNAANRHSTIASRIADEIDAMIRRANQEAAA